MEQSPTRKAQRDLGISILAELCPSAEVQLGYDEGCDAVLRALVGFEARASKSDRSNYRFGPLGYDRLPHRLPKREIAIAVVLADLITGFRKDGGAKGGVLFPRKPELSPNLPWTAIAEFSVALSDDPDVSISPDNVAGRVRNIVGKVTRIWRLPPTNPKRKS